MKAFLKGLAAIAVLAMAVNTANAAFVAGFNGNTQFGPLVLGTGGDDPSDGVVSFAVWANTDGDWTDEFGATFDGDITSSSTFSGNIDAAAKFVYFYQVTNNDPGTTDKSLSLLLIPEAVPGVYTSFGFVHRHVFDDGAPVGAAPNVALGTDGLAADTPNDHTPGEGTSPPAGFFDTTGGGTVPESQDPTGAQVVNDVVYGGSVLQFTLNFVGTGSYSSILFATSNAEPIYLRGELQDGQPRAAGDVAVPTPEPATLALLLCGAPVGLVALRRRRKTA